MKNNKGSKTAKRVADMVKAMSEEEDNETPEEKAREDDAVMPQEDDQENEEAHTPKRKGRLFGSRLGAVIITKGKHKNK